MRAWEERGLYVDRRVGGRERWIYGDPRDGLMRVPDLVVHSAVFLGAKRESREQIAGTGFFLGVPSERRHGVWHGYLVTARHCVLAAERYGTMFVRINSRAGPSTAGEARLIELQEAHWLFHEDESNDVAVLPMAPDSDELLFVVTRQESLATAEVVEKEAIGIGDDLVVTGLFTSHFGRTINRPIVRAGIIAAMPDEPLDDQQSGQPYDAYLAEVRSIGGLSGSPVWVVINPARVKPGSHERENRLHFYLLGLIRGHWDKNEAWLSDFGDPEVESLNTGIAIVTPIQKALDIIGSEELMKDRKRSEDNLPTEGQQVADWSVEKSEYERFEELARGLVNVPKPEIDEQRDDPS